MEIKREKTERGFGRWDFADSYGKACSLQKSSLATEQCIWFGPDDAHPQILVPGEGWQPVPFPEGTAFYTRMHLSQEQVRDLLPALQHFAEHGELPNE